MSHETSFTLVSFRKADRKLQHAVEALAGAGRVLDLADHLGLPVLRARLALAQFGEAAVEQQQIGGKRGVRELGILDAARGPDAQMHQGA